MKLTHFALGCLFLLLSTGIYLTLKSDMDARQESQNAFNKQLVDQMAETRKTAALLGPSDVANVAAQGATVAPSLPQARPTAVTNPPQATLITPPPALQAIAPEAPAVQADHDDRLIREREQALLNDGPEASERIAKMADEKEADTGRRLNKEQQIVAAQPIAARIKDSRDGTDFVVIDKGSADFGMRPGDSFAVRRGTAVIGRVIIGDTVEKNESIANVKSLVTGMTIQNGDELIQFDEHARR